MRIRRLFTVLILLFVFLCSCDTIDTQQDIKNNLQNDATESESADLYSYISLTELVGKELEIKQTETITYEDYLNNRFFDAIDFTTIHELYGQGELVLKSGEVILGFFGDVPYNPRSFKYFDIPEQLSNNIAIRRINKTREIVFDKTNNILMVIDFDYKWENPNLLERLRITECIKFNAIESNNVSFIDGYYKNNSSYAIIETLDGECFLFNIDTKGVIHSVTYEGWMFLVQ